jgi:hypothetical protein
VGTAVAFLPVSLSRTTVAALGTAIAALAPIALLIPYDSVSRRVHRGITASTWLVSTAVLRGWWRTTVAAAWRGVAAATAAVALRRDIAEAAAVAGLVSRLVPAVLAHVLDPIAPVAIALVHKVLRLLYRLLFRLLAVEVVEAWRAVVSQKMNQGMWSYGCTFGLGEFRDLGRSEAGEQLLHERVARLLACLSEVVLVRLHRLKARRASDSCMKRGQSVPQWTDVAILEQTLVSETRLVVLELGPVLVPIYVLIVLARVVAAEEVEEAHGRCDEGQIGWVRGLYMSPVHHDQARVKCDPLPDHPRRRRQSAKQPSAAVVHSEPSNTQCAALTAKEIRAEDIEV